MMRSSVSRGTRPPALGLGAAGLSLWAGDSGFVGFAAAAFFRGGAAAARA
jgi:hypothetical protein